MRKRLSEADGYTDRDNYDEVDEVRPQKQRSGSSGGLFTKGRMDPFFLIMVMSLLVVGLVCLFSSSYAYALANYGDSYHFIKRQAIFAVLGVAIMLIVSKIDYHIYRKFTWPVFFVSLALLVVVRLMPPLQEGFDYHRWIVIGSFNFQPSEIAKFAIILLFAHTIAKNFLRMEELKFTVLYLVVPLGVTCALVVIEPHLSATILIFAIGASMLFIGGIKMRHAAMAVIGGVGLAAAAIMSGVVGYGSTRIQLWFDPWSDLTGDGWQTAQSLMAIGSGGFLGTGLGGSQQKHLWVPEPQNDFIFSIVCEELGFVGAIAIIIMFIVLIWRGFNIAYKAPDRFGALFVIGLTIQVGLQAALNIMVVTNTIPNTGISLPFFSYGGTSLIMLLGQMGMVLSVSRSCKMTKK